VDYVKSENNIGKNVGEEISQHPLENKTFVFAEIEPADCRTTTFLDSANRELEFHFGLFRCSLNLDVSVLMAESTKSFPIH
jgi:hypothetical protein